MLIPWHSRLTAYDHVHSLQRMAKSPTCVQESTVGMTFKSVSGRWLHWREGLDMNNGIFQDREIFKM